MNPHQPASPSRRYQGGYQLEDNPFHQPVQQPMTHLEMPSADRLQYQPTVSLFCLFIAVGSRSGY